MENRNWTKNDLKFAWVKTENSSKLRKTELKPLVKKWTMKKSNPSARVHITQYHLLTQESLLNWDFLNRTRLKLHVDARGRVSGSPLGQIEQEEWFKKAYFIQPVKANEELWSATAEEGVEMSCWKQVYDLLIDSSFVWCRLASWTKTPPGGQSWFL